MYSPISVSAASMNIHMQTTKEKVPSENITASVPENYVHNSTLVSKQILLSILSLEPLAFSDQENVCR
jgi:hypothetical protein